MTEAFLKRRFTPILLVIVLLGAGLRIWLGALRYVEYDGYWHVFIAGQDNWTNFWWDVHSNAHPPLFFLLLHYVLFLGKSFLVYRAISLVTGAASIFLMGRIAERVTVSRAWALAAALAFALATPAIVIACEVRSYMLAVFFILYSFVYFLEVIAPERAGPPLRARIAFALLACGACYSHYFAFFYVAACGLVLLGRAVMRRQGLLADGATLLPILLAVISLAHIRRVAMAFPHLAPYYFDPHSGETVGAFLIRNWWSLFNLFWPYAPASRVVALAGLAVGIIAGAWLLPTFMRRQSLINARAAWTIGVTVAMLAEIVAAALIRKYPFGGDLRQEFLLFPFFVLCVAVAMDRLTALTPTRARFGLAAAAAIWIVWISAVRFYQEPKNSAPVLAEEMWKFQRVFPAPESVYLDQWNLIEFFQFYDTWKWTFLRREPDLPNVDVYRLTRGNRQLLVFRNKLAWNFKPDDAGVYQAASTFLKRREAPAVTLFCMQQTPPATPRKELWTATEMLARESNVCIDRLELGSQDWFPEFRPLPCDWAQLPPPRRTGRFDAGAVEIEYRGAWQHASYLEPGAGTFSIANQSGATARLEFEGTSIAWVCEKAFNRGLASVRIDGADRGTIDQYVPGIERNVTMTFGNLPSGRHTFEVTVLGRKDPASAGTLIDIDSFVVR